MIRLYNTATRSIEKFKPLHHHRVSIYSCGPTVYDRQHIGNLRKALFDDLLRRVLIMHGYLIYSVTNITDVGHLTLDDQDQGEDKIEKGAKQAGQTAVEIARKYESLWKHDLEKLHVLPSNHYPRATDYISQQINLIKRLEKKGYTYLISDGIYFDTTKLPSYGDFAQLDLENLEAGARVSIGDKKSTTDFALWKFSSPDSQRQMEWASPWGIGFPGWHSECVVMSDTLLHAPFDIHTGGKDHIPVHHTNEIAQFEADTGKPLAHYWLHSYFLNVKDQKMSKSTGIFLTLDDLVSKGYHPLDFRLLTLMAHYRSDIDFSWTSLTQAQQSRRRLVDFCMRVEQLPHKKNPILEQDVKKLFNQFRNALYFDLDSPKAMALIFDYVRTVHAEIDQGSAIPKRHIIKLLQKIDRIFALDLMPHDVKIPTMINNLALKRQKVREEGNYQMADDIRDQIAREGYDIKDISHGKGYLITKKDHT